MAEFDGLVIDINSNEVVIDGFNEAFDGTPFYGKDFKINVSPVSHKEYDSIKKKYTNRRKGTINEAGLERDLFMRQVNSWENIIMPDGKKLPCTREIKEIVTEKLFFFTRAVNIACLNARMAIKEEEEKN